MRLALLCFRFSFLLRFFFFFFFSRSLSILLISSEQINRYVFLLTFFVTYTFLLLIRISLYLFFSSSFFFFFNFQFITSKTMFYTLSPIHPRIVIIFNLLYFFTSQRSTKFYNLLATYIPHLQNILCFGCLSQFEFFFFFFFSRQGREVQTQSCKWMNIIATSAGVVVLP